MADQAPSIYRVKNLWQAGAIPQAGVDSHSRQTVFY
jgi:hypothetical protein